MIVQNIYNRKCQEYIKLGDIQEDNIKPNKLNATDLEKYLVRINVGSKRRLRNNHAARLAAYKAK